MHSPFSPNNLSSLPVPESRARAPLIRPGPLAIQALVRASFEVLILDSPEITTPLDSNSLLLYTSFTAIVLLSHLNLSS